MSPDQLRFSVIVALTICPAPCESMFTLCRRLRVTMTTSAAKPAPQCEAGAVAWPCRRPAPGAAALSPAAADLVFVWRELPGEIEIVMSLAQRAAVRCHAGSGHPVGKWHCNGYARTHHSPVVAFRYRTSCRQTRRKGLTPPLRAAGRHTSPKP